MSTYSPLEKQQMNEILELKETINKLTKENEELKQLVKRLQNPIFPIGIPIDMYTPFSQSYRKS